MNGPVFPPNPTPGEVFCGWMWNGNQWICTSGGQAVVQQVFEASGVYLPSPGLVTLIVEVVGGGGGGGGAVGQLNGPPITNTGWMLSGGGGASGGYSRSALAAAVVRGGVNITIGAGGVAGLPVYEGMGGAGGQSAFGVLVTASGGAGGGSAASSGSNLSFGTGGARAPLGTGQLAAYGNGGEHGEAIMYDGGIAQVILYGGRGGGSYFQSAEVGAVQTPTGSPGIFGYLGAGGGGGASPYAAASVPGGAGGSGVIIVTEYCLGFADGGGGGGSCGPARVALTSDGRWRASALEFMDE